MNVYGSPILTLVHFAVAVMINFSNHPAPIRAYWCVPLIDCLQFSLPLHIHANIANLGTAILIYDNPELPSLFSTHHHHRWWHHHDCAWWWCWQAQWQDVHIGQTFYCMIMQTHRLHFPSSLAPHMSTKLSAHSFISGLFIISLHKVAARIIQEILSGFFFSLSLLIC